jgi:ribonuclease P protein component
VNAPERPPKPQRRRLALPKSSRIVRGGDFQRAYKTGARSRGEVLVVVAVPNGLDRPRLGLSVGRAIWPGAVQRNRVRRVFREAFRLSQHELPSGFDLVLIPARPRLEPELAATRDELVRHARRAAEKHAARERSAGRAERP